MPEKYWYGQGRRKSAVAHVRLMKLRGAQPGSRLVNGQPFGAYFPTVAMQHAVLAPLKVTSQIDHFGFHVRVSGGGKMAHAGAVQLALARALVGVQPSHRKQLKDSGYLTRDPRAKERKKPGLKRARRAPQFSKR